MKKLVLHIGYPKTATTTLQRGVFPKVQNLEYVGNSIYPNGKIEKKVIKKENDLFASNERVISLKYGHEGKSEKIKEQVESENLDVNILFTIRNQSEMLQSVFTFYHGIFKNEGYTCINDMVLREIGRKGKLEIENWLDYEGVVNEFSNTFGSENIYVLKYEDFASNRERFFETLSNAVGESSRYIQKVAEGSTSYNVQPKKEKKYSKPSKLYTWLSHFKSDHLSGMSPLSEYPLGGYVKRLASAFNEEVYLNSRSKKIIRERYGRPNNNLFEQFNLRNYGEYPMGENW